ncbi:hypothetical protein Aph01nite_32740 [Acrocarpospora phusangensis]|uniref:Uncharacterized protein n=1 Tax=Acrocarpospora phusangensis TaxID=1070424 RepID=A0A919UKE8_9ACTN|nr:hypothetical protein [Acrocarpospora phusangensis]GIH24964.1 hypothetical protein Aph01nite_32740 [Acrocarpospora phusangensis]
MAINAPSSRNLGSGGSGQSLTAQLGSVSVADTRGGLATAWTARAAATDFTTGGGSAAETIGRARVSYWSGIASATAGTGVFTPGQATALLAVPLSGNATAYTLTLGVGDTSATWNPHIVVSLPAAAVAGTYTGRITHSVA